LKPVSALAIVLFVAGTVIAAAGADAQYIITNDDNITNTVTFYSVDQSGALTPVQTVDVAGFGISSGYFGMNRLSIVKNATNKCVYASNAASGDIATIDATSLQLKGNFFGSGTDAGTANGIGLAMSKKYLYASYSDSSTIGTFKVKPDCQLKFVGDITVGGKRGGIIDGMAVRGNMMVTTYGDGSIESFDISAGVPVSHGDLQVSRAGRGGWNYPNGIDITKDGHFAIFGDTSTSTVIEVSDLSSGKLAKTVPYHLGKQISSSTVMLSPDETMLYIVNTQGDKVSAAFFDKNTGVLTKGCSSNYIKGMVKKWSYLGGLTLRSNTGNGGGVYVAEFGAPSYIAIVDVTSGGGQCTLRESANSPADVPTSFGLLSVGSYPPRTF
jgi:hypothetical protein